MHLHSKEKCHKFWSLYMISNASSFFSNISAFMSSASLSPYFFSELPREKWWGAMDLYQWEGFWYRLHFLEGAIAAQSGFSARDEDVILASPTKAGSTWLKALIPCLMDEKSRTLGEGEIHHDFLIENHPNNLMPSLEFQIFNLNYKCNLSEMPSPRLFRTHVPYEMLSESAKKTRCKIVYITRDPKDVFVSLWHFLNSMRKPEAKPYPIEEAFDKFCRGIHGFGPFHDNVLGYWKESLARPEKILFIKYEEMKKNTIGEVKKLASFLGKPFTSEEEIEKVLWRCSLDRLKSLDVNKEGSDPWSAIPRHAYFRKGVVGDWKNHLSAEMKERLDEIPRKKFQGSGLDILPK